MLSNKARDTLPELLLRASLTQAGFGHFKTTFKDAPGRPDIAYSDECVAVFMQGCYWHRCPYCDLPLPRRNRPFWRRKFALNALRDRRVARRLHRLGWSVVHLRECRLKASPASCIRRVAAALAGR